MMSSVHHAAVSVLCLSESDVLAAATYCVTKPLPAPEGGPHAPQVSHSVHILTPLSGCTANCGRQCHAYCHAEPVSLRRACPSHGGRAGLYSSLPRHRDVLRRHDRPWNGSGRRGDVFHHDASRRRTETARLLSRGCRLCRRHV